MTRTSTGDPDVVDNAEADRYEIFDDGSLAGFITYRSTSESVTLIHAEVDAAFDGKGLGSRLAKAALDNIRAQHKTVHPRCPFVIAFIQRHPEYGDLVAGA